MYSVGMYVGVLTLDIPCVNRIYTLEMALIISVCRWQTAGMFEQVIVWIREMINHGPGCLMEDGIMGGNYTESAHPILGISNRWFLIQNQKVRVVLGSNLVIYACDRDRRYGQDRETGTGSETNGGRYTKTPGDTPSGFKLMDFFYSFFM